MPHNDSFCCRELQKLNSSLRSDPPEFRPFRKKESAEAAELPRMEERCEKPPEKLSEKPRETGLLCFREWWERREVVFSVGGKLIRGTPIFVCGNTVRMVNKDHSYFIPLENVDFIQTGDGIPSALDFERGGFRE